MPTGRDVDEAVMRSMITLKALTYAPTGGMVAAPTTSCPNSSAANATGTIAICWLRDATLVLLGAMNAGFFDEAQAWREWLFARGRRQPRSIADHVRHRRRAAADRMDRAWLPGYENSAPVRIGNAAHSQLQLDVFGEIMDVHHQARRSGLSTNNSGSGSQLAFLEHCSKSGGSPTKAFGKFAAPRNNSPTQR